MYRSPMMNKLIIPAFAVAAMGYAVYAAGVMRPRTVLEAPLSTPPERAFEKSVGAVGVVEPASELVSIAPRVGGWIESVHVVAGQRVKAGEVMFTLDGADLRAEVELRESAVRVAEARLGRLRASPRAEDVPIARAGVDEAAAKLEDLMIKQDLIERVSDRRAVSEEERNQRRVAVARGKAELAARKGELDRLLSGAWKEDVAVAERELEMAKASVGRARADLDRLTTRAPMDAVVLRIVARPGQYAPAGVIEEPLVVLGSPGPLCVRADVNEEDVPRMSSGARAVAMVRGGGNHKIPLEMVRVEPLVVPKRALSGFAQERVDTRVLQVIFRVKGDAQNVYVGQQVDLFIESAAGVTVNGRTASR